MSKSTGNLIEGRRVVKQYSLHRLYRLFIGGINWPAEHQSLVTRGWLHPFVGTSAFQVVPSRGFPHQPALSRNYLVHSCGRQGMEFPNPCEFVTDALSCVSRSAKTPQLQHLHLPDLAANSGLRDRTIHHWTDDLLVKWHTVSHGQAASPVRERARHVQRLGRLILNLADVCRPGNLCIKGHPLIPCCFNPLYSLSEKLDWSALLDAFWALKKLHSGAVWDLEGNPPIP